LDKLNREHSSTVCLPVEYHGDSARIDCDHRVLAVLVGTPNPHGILDDRFDVFLRDLMENLVMNFDVQRGRLLLRLWIRGLGLVIVGVIPDLDSLYCALVDQCLRSVDHELGMGAEPIINRSTNVELDL